MKNKRGVLFIMAGFFRGLLINFDRADEEKECVVVGKEIKNKEIVKLEKQYEETSSRLEKAEKEISKIRYERMLNRVERYIIELKNLVDELPKEFKGGAENKKMQVVFDYSISIRQLAEDIKNEVRDYCNLPFRW